MISQSETTENTIRDHPEQVETQEQSPSMSWSRPPIAPADDELAHRVDEADAQYDDEDHADGRDHEAGEGSAHLVVFAEDAMSSYWLSRRFMAEKRGIAWGIASPGIRLTLRVLVTSTA